MLICDKCGHENVDRQLFCDGCGERIEQVEEHVAQKMQDEIQTEREDSRAQLAQQTLCLVVFLLVLIILCREFIASNPPQPDTLPVVEDSAAALPKYKHKRINLQVPVKLPTD